MDAASVTSMQPLVKLLLLVLFIRESVARGTEVYRCNNPLSEKIKACITYRALPGRNAIVWWLVLGQIRVESIKIHNPSTSRSSDFELHDLFQMMWCMWHKWGSSCTVRRDRRSQVLYVGPQSCGWYAALLCTPQFCCDGPSRFVVRGSDVLVWCVQ